MLFNVYIFRAHRYKFTGIEAPSHLDAAKIASDMDLNLSSENEDGEEVLPDAIVDVVGDENFEQSQTVQLYGPEKYTYKNDSCPFCHGSGVVETDLQFPMDVKDCSKCGGGGLVSLAIEMRVKKFLDNMRYDDPLYNIIANHMFGGKHE